MKTSLILVFISIISVAQNPIEEDCSYKEWDTYLVVEEMPEFPGGEQKMLEYIFSEITYPPYSDEIESSELSSGVITFIINKDGSLSNIAIKDSFGSEAIDNEYMRVIASMPKWKPGKQESKAVKVIFHLPIRINLK